jgi:hypothetical protein
MLTELRPLQTKGRSFLPKVFMKRHSGLLFFLWVISSSVYSQNADIDILHNINPVNPGASFFWKATSSSAYPITAGVQGGLMLYDYFHSDSSRGMILPHIAEKLIVLAVTEGVKLAVNRSRPYITYPGLVHPY